MSGFRDAHSRADAWAACGLVTATLGAPCQAVAVAGADSLTASSVPTAPDGASTADRRRYSPTLRAMVFAASAAAALGAVVPLGDGSEALGGFDLLILLSIVALVRRRSQRFPRGATVTWAIVLLLLSISIMVPLSPHFVIRSAGLILVLQAVKIESSLIEPIIYGFLAGGVGQVAAGLGAYVSAGTLSADDAAFKNMQSYRALFDWLAGTSDNPPLSASGLLRMQGLAGHPNELAMVLAVGSLLALYALSNRIVRISVFSVLCLGTILTLSRLSIVALIVGLLLRPTGRAGVPGRVLGLLGGVSAVVLSLNSAVRQRLLDVNDGENARGRSAGPADLLNDATLMPDGLLETRHNSLAFMLDQAGVLLGTCWVVLLVVGIYHLTSRSWTKQFMGTWFAVVLLFLTEDRIQSPSFLTGLAATAACGIYLFSDRFAARDLASEAAAATTSDEHHHRHDPGTLRS